MSAIFMYSSAVRGLRLALLISITCSLTLYLLSRQTCLYSDQQKNMFITILSII